MTTATDEPGTDARFSSLAELRCVHADLLRRHRDERNSLGFLDEAKRFLARGRLTILQEYEAHLDVLRKADPRTEDR